MHEPHSVRLYSDYTRKENGFPLLHIVDWCSLTLPQKAQQQKGKNSTWAACYYFYLRAGEFHIFITDLGMFTELIFSSHHSPITFYFLSPHLSCSDISGSARFFPLGWFPDFICYLSPVFFLFPLISFMLSWTFFPIPSLKHFLTIIVSSNLSHSNIGF